MTKLLEIFITFSVIIIILYTSLIIPFENYMYSQKYEGNEQVTEDQLIATTNFSIRENDDHLEILVYNNFYAFLPEFMHFYKESLSLLNPIISKLYTDYESLNYLIDWLVFSLFFHLLIIILFFNLYIVKNIVTWLASWLISSNEKKKKKFSNLIFGGLLIIVFFSSTYEESEFVSYAFKIPITTFLILNDRPNNELKLETFEIIDYALISSSTYKKNEKDGRVYGKFIEFFEQHQERILVYPGDQLNSFSNPNPVILKDITATTEYKDSNPKKKKELLKKEIKENANILRNLVYNVYALQANRVTVEQDEYAEQLINKYYSDNNKN